MANANVKAFGVTNIKSYVPLMLDLDELNYDSWRELFETHCISFEVLGHLDGTSVKPEANDQPWKNLDSLVKMWIYTTIKPNLLQMVMKRGDTARQIWQKIEGMFQDNKDARANELEMELRSMQLGEMTITDYCHKIKVITDLLANINEPVSQRTLVMCIVNGFPPKYEQVSGIIRHQKPMPTFLEVRSMLLTEESRLNRLQGQPRDNPSALTILYAGDSNRNICRNFQHGHCQFGERCRFVHGNGDNRGRNGNFQNHRGGGTTQQQSGNATGGQEQPNRIVIHYVWNGTQTSQATQTQHGRPFTRTMPTGQQQTVVHYGPDQIPQPPIGPGSILGGPSQQQQSNSVGGGLGQAQQAHHVSSVQPSLLGPTLVHSVHEIGQSSNNDQHTSLPQAFNSMTLQDLGQPGGYMDIGATSHITSDAGLPDSTNPPPM